MREMEMRRKKDFLVYFVSVDEVRLLDFPILDT